MCSCSSYFTLCVIVFLFFFFNDTATTEIYTLSLHDALPISAIATIETALGSGPFASNTTFVNAVLLDVFFGDRKSTRLNSSHVAISYAVFCLKKKKKKNTQTTHHNTQVNKLPTHILISHVNR